MSIAEKRVCEMMYVACMIACLLMLSLLACG